MARTPAEATSLQLDTFGINTESSDEQIRCERHCASLLTQMAKCTRKDMEELIDMGFADDAGNVRLMRLKHLKYLRKGLHGLSAGHACLDASKPWLIYWMVHSIGLLGVNFDQDASAKRIASRAVDTLRRCRCRTPGDPAAGEGFGGGPQQLPHLAPTYAAVLALCSVGTEEALRTPNRAAIYRWMLTLKQRDGSFSVHKNGEGDIRGTYLCLSAAKVLNLLTPELCKGAATFAARCQSAMGGFGGEPGNEGHGGYAFNAVASLAILNRLDLVDADLYAGWLCRSQMRLEGGFQGRINKLVDGCYSFWQGAVPAILARARSGLEAKRTTDRLPYDGRALQRYILMCCQQANGGLRDKPSKPRDHYHTCYCLSGLSVAQHYGDAVFGSPENRLERTDPVLNVRADLLERALRFYSAMPSDHVSLMRRSSAGGS